MRSALAVGGVLVACLACTPATQPASPSPRSIPATPAVTALATSSPVQTVLTGGFAGRIVLSDATCALQEANAEPSGELSVVVENETDSFAGFDLFRFLPGASFDQLVAHIARENEQIAAGKPPIGHPAQIVEHRAQEAVAAGQSAEISEPAEPGTWAVVCLVAPGPSPKGFFVAGPIEIR